MSSGGRNRYGGGNRDSFTIDLSNWKDKLIVALLAVIFGGSSSLGVLNWTPIAEEIVRPNKYTSLDGDRDKKEILGKVDENKEEVLDKLAEDRRNVREEHRAIWKAIRDVEQQSAVTNDYITQHRVESQDGFHRIEDCEKGLATMRAEVSHCQEQMREYRNGSR